MQKYFIVLALVFAGNVWAFGQEETEVLGRFSSHEQTLSTPLRVPFVSRFPEIQPLKTTAVTPWQTIKVNQSVNVEPQNEPYIAVNPLNKDNFVCVYRDFRLGGGENHTYAVRSVGIAATTDAGLHWTETWAEYQDHNRFSDPGIAVDSSGKFYVITIDYFTADSAMNTQTMAYSVRSSTDGGLTWSAANPTDTLVGLHDKELLAIDNDPVSPYRGNIYVSGNGPNGHFVVHSADGVHWSPPVSTTGNYLTPAVGPHGIVYIEHFHSDAIWVGHSFDGGETFTDTRASGELTPASVILSDYATSIGMVGICADNSYTSTRGNVYIIWGSAPGGDGDIFCVVSQDSGVTWSKPVRVNTDPYGNGKDQFHYWATVDDSGFVDVIFLDRRDDPANLYANAYFAQSRDGGRSFKNFRITPESFDPSITPSSDARYGDYVGISAAQGRIVPVWNDTRLGDQDIYVALIEQNQVGSITGTVFFDCNGDGVRQPEDSACAGIAVIVSHDGGTDTAWTDENGGYRFNGMYAGSYNVLVNSRQTFPAGNQGYTIALSAQQNSDNNNFGIQDSPTGLYPGWNLVSVPRTIGRKASSALFPSGIESGPFTFLGRYVAEDSLVQGFGYWIKTGCDVTRSLPQDSLLADTIHLRLGWNLVGALQVPVLAAHATTDPPGISNLVFTGYASSEGYSTATSLEPGKGYWLKTTGVGNLILNSKAPGVSGGNISKMDIRTGYGRLIISDRYSHQGTVMLSQHMEPDISRFELPPAPPADGTDVRFASQRSLDVIYPGEILPHIINARGFRDEVSITWNIPNPEKYLLKTASGTTVITGSGRAKLQVSDLSSLSISAPERPSPLPDQFVLYKNYPDPFNPVTTIRYDLAKAVHVSLIILDLLGREVSRLVDENQPAGSYAVPFDASMYASGIYFYRLEAEHFHKTEKMVLIR